MRTKNVIYKESSESNFPFKNDHTLYDDPYSIEQRRKKRNSLNEENRAQVKLKRIDNENNE